MLRRHKELVSIVDKNEKEAKMVAQSLSKPIVDALSAVFRYLDRSPVSERTCVVAFVCQCVRVVQIFFFSSPLGDGQLSACC